MKVLIHALGADTGGAANHLSHFVSALQRSQSPNVYWIICRDKFPNIQETSRIKFILCKEKTFKGFLNRIRFDQFKISQIIQEKKIDLLVSLTNFGPVKAPVPHIVFQRNPLYFSQWYRTHASKRDWIVNELRSKFTYFIMKNADRVVTPSDSMASMIHETYPYLETSKFYRLYHGFNAHETGSNLPEAAKTALNFTGFKVLFPSLAAFHKGIFLLFDTIRILQKSLSEPLKFYLTFTEAEALESYADVERPKDWGELVKNVVFLGKIPQSAMKSLYESCDLMFYPSLCESFGFSMIESMGSKLPIVAVDTPINREMCQEAALYFSPDNIQMAADHVEKILHSDQLRNKLVLNGEKRISQYDWSWERYCTEFENLLAKVVKS